MYSSSAESTPPHPDRCGTPWASRSPRPTLHRAPELLIARRNTVISPAPSATSNHSVHPPVQGSDGTGLLSRQQRQGRQL
jgi:hypothetical protein